MSDLPPTLQQDRNALDVIFLKHFYASHGVSVLALARLIAVEYLDYLIIKRGAFVPDRFKNTVLLDLMDEIKELVDKKISGFSSISAYLEQNQKEVESKRDECEKKYYDLF